MAENLNQKARGVAVSNRQIPVSNQPSGEPQVSHYRVAEVQGYFQVRGLEQAHSKPRSWSSSSLAA